MNLAMLPAHRLPELRASLAALDAAEAASQPIRDRIASADAAILRLREKRAGLTDAPLHITPDPDRVERLLAAEEVASLPKPELRQRLSSADEVAAQRAQIDADIRALEATQAADTGRLSRAGTAALAARNAYLSTIAAAAAETLTDAARSFARDVIAPIFSLNFTLGEAAGQPIAALNQPILSLKLAWNLNDAAGRMQTVLAWPPVSAAEWPGHVILLPPHKADPAALAALTAGLRELSDAAEAASVPA